MTDAPVRVLVVDDSSTSRALLVHLFDREPDMAVVGEAVDGTEAIELAAKLHPSVIVMDIDMPKLDGLSATRRIMAEHPTPIVVVTASRDPRDVEVALRAVRAGALTVLPKPTGPASPDHEAEARHLVSLVKAFADVKVVRRRWSHRPGEGEPTPASPRRAERTPAAVGVAASTGGPAALFRFLELIPRTIDVPVLVVQHISEGFVPGLVRWLASGTELPVKLAEDGETLRGGVVFGMPRAVTAAGLAHVVGPVEELALNLAGSLPIRGS